jgi:hypothetical protein
LHCKELFFNAVEVRGGFSEEEIDIHASKLRKGMKYIVLVATNARIIKALFSWKRLLRIFEKNFNGNLAKRTV